MSDIRQGFQNVDAFSAAAENASTFGVAFRFF